MDWPLSRTGKQAASLSWQEQHEKVLLLSPSMSYLLLARHWTRTTGRTGNRHERYELHLFGLPPLRPLKHPKQQQVVGLVTGSREVPQCCGGRDLVTWWWEGSRHGGIGEGVRVHWVSEDVVAMYS